MLIKMLHMGPLKLSKTVGFLVTFPYLSCQVYALILNFIPQMCNTIRAFISRTVKDTLKHLLPRN